jgi:hypothetical protein
LIKERVANDILAIVGEGKQRGSEGSTPSHSSFKPLQFGTNPDPQNTPGEEAHVVEEASIETGQQEEQNTDVIVNGIFDDIDTGTDSDGDSLL